MKSAEMVLHDDDPRVVAARSAEARFYGHYGLKPSGRYVFLEQYGIRVRLVETGAGAPVVIVPGNTGDGFPFLPLIAGLKNRRVIVINRPGGGLSDGMDHREVDFRKFAVDTIAAVFDFLEIEKAPIIAHSMGGHWSLWFALDRPARVESLILPGVPGNILDTCPPFLLRLASVPALGRLLFPFITPKTIEKSMRSLLFMGHSKDVLDMLPEQLAECYFYFQQLPYYRVSSLSLMEKANRLSGSRPEVRITADELRAVRCRVLMLWGANDPFGKTAAGRKIAELLPRGEFREMPGGGHLPWLDGPEECAELVLDFLAGNKKFYV